MALKRSLAQLVIAPNGLQRGVHAVNRLTPFYLARMLSTTSSRRGLTKEDAWATTHFPCEMDNLTLAILSAHGNHDADLERLVREIMRTDGVDWDTARVKMEEIRSHNRKWLGLGTFPQRLGLYCSILGTFGSIPFCYSSSLGKHMNDQYFPMDPYIAEELNTVLEVGYQTGKFMGPVLGTASFTILCFQFARAKMLDIEIAPVTRRLKAHRAAYLLKEFPNYNKQILENVAQTSSMRPDLYFRATSSKNSYSKMDLAGREIKRPTMQEAQDMPVYMWQMSVPTLHILAGSGDREACKELLVREVMRVDDLDWDEASHRVEEIEDSGSAVRQLFSLPYKFGIILAIGLGLGCILLVFEYNTVLAFNEYYVTRPVPDQKDLASVLEVGAFSFEWVGPAITLGSFILIGLQLARGQMMNMGYAPFSGFVRSLRARRMSSKFPQYNHDVLKRFSKSAPLSGRGVLSASKSASRRRGQTRDTNTGR